MSINTLINCYKNLVCRVIALEGIEEVDNQVIALLGNVLTLSGGLVPDTSVDLTPFLDNTDDQVLSANLSGTDLVLTISNGNTVTIPLASINTDDQTITLAGNNLSIEDGNTIDLTPFLDNTDDQILSGSVVGTNLVLTLEDGGTVTIPLSDLGSDDQLLTLVGTNLSIEDGNTIDLSAFLDNTDEQTLSISGDQLTISNGNTVTLPAGSTSVLSQNDTTGVITHDDGDGTVTTAEVTSADAGNILITGTDGGTFLSPTVITGNPIEVDQSYIWAGEVLDSNVHDNDDLDLSQNRADAGWAFTPTNQVTYTGSPDHVEIDVNLAPNAAFNSYWATVKIFVLRNGVKIGAGGQEFMLENGAYSDDQTVHINIIDENPGTNPVYTFTTEETDVRTGNAPADPTGTAVSLKAVEKVQVLDANGITIGTPVVPSLTLTKETHRVVVGTIITNATGAITSQWGSVTAVDGAGIFTWTSTEPIRSIGGLGKETVGERDNPKVTIVDGFTAGDTTGQVMITSDDNGTGADPFDDDAGAVVNFYADKTFITDIVGTNITIN